MTAPNTCHEHGVNLQSNCSFQARGDPTLLHIYVFAFSPKLQAVGCDFLQQAGCPSRGNANLGPQAAHWHVSRLGLKQEVLILGVALAALATMVLGPSGSDPAWWLPNTCHEHGWNF